MKKWVFSVTGSVAGSVFSVIGGILIAWALIPEIRGDVAKIFLYSQLVILLLTYAANDYVIVNHKSITQSINYCLSSLPIHFIMCIFAFYYLPYFIDLSNDALYSWITIYGICFFPVYYIRVILVSVLLVNGLAKTVALERTLYGLIYLTLLALLYLLNLLTAELVIITSLIGEIVTLFYIMYFVSLNTTLNVNNLFNFNFARKWYRENFTQYLSFSLSVVSKNVDRLSVFILFSNTQAGFYVVASAVTTLLIQFFSKASQDAILIDSATEKNIRLLTLKPLFFIVLIYFVFIFLFYLFGDIFINIVYGQNYMDAAELLIPITTLGFFISSKELLIKAIKPHFPSQTAYFEACFLAVFFMVSLYAVKVIDMHLVSYIYTCSLLTLVFTFLLSCYYYYLVTHVSE